MLKQHHNTKTGGFTLLELMVALVAGLIAISAIYYVGAASSRFFHEQQRISQTQMSVRMAAEQLRDDIERAGMGASLNSEVALTCMNFDEEIRAVEIDNNANTDALPNADVNGVRADRIQLSGNYSTDSMYLSTQPNATRNGFRLQVNRPSFRRDFGTVGDDFSVEAFEEVFAVGRMLRLDDLGKQYFVTVRSADSSNQSFTFSPTIPQASAGCTPLNNVDITPLDIIEYTVLNPWTTDVARLRFVADPDRRDLDEARGHIPSLLVRRFVNNPQDTIRVVLEWVANVTYDVTMDDQTVVNGPPILTRYQGEEAATELELNPHHVRAIHFNLSARTAEQDPRFPFTLRAAGGPLLRYQTVSTLPGAARVRSVRGDVALRNVGRVVRP